MTAPGAGSTQAVRRRRLRLAGLFLIAGLAVEALSLQWAHPTAFLVFLLLGSVLVLGGIGLYLRSFITD